MSPRMRVLQGALEPRQRSGLEAAYEHFRLERQGDLVSPATLENYDYLLQPFLRWLASQWPEVRRFDDLKVAVVRAYRAELTVSKRRDGRPLAPHTILDTHRVLLSFFRWARAEGYSVDPRFIELKRPRVPDKEAHAGVGYPRTCPGRRGKADAKPWWQGERPIGQRFPTAHHLWRLRGSDSDLARRYSRRVPVRG